MSARIEAFFDPDTFTYSYVVSDPQTRQCAVIDSVLDYDAASGRTSHQAADRIIDYIRTHELQVQWLLETHVHADHLSAAHYLKQHLGGRLAIGERITEVQRTFAELFNAGADFATDGRQFDQLLRDGERFQIGSLDAQALHTPGHTPACLTYLIGDAAFVGDTLFMPDYGTARADFPGGDARTLYRSIRRLLALPDETRLFLCHDYKAPGRDDYRWETTVGEQRRSSVHVHDGVNEDDFVAMREQRDAGLSVPKLLLPSIQVNIRAGHFDQAEANGVTYLRIPVKWKAGHP